MKTQSLLAYVACAVDYRGKLADVPAPIEDNLPPGTWLIGWQCGFEPMVVAVLPDAISCMADAEEAALDYLRGKNWFNGDERECDIAEQIRQFDVEKLLAQLEITLDISTNE